jgi:hypothetical protein
MVRNSVYTIETTVFSFIAFEIFSWCAPSGFCVRLLEPASKELKARKAPSNLKIKRNSKREKYMKRDIKGISLILPASDQKKKRKQTRRKAKDDRQDICIDLLPKK